MFDKLNLDELSNVAEYTSFPKTFKEYKWYKPLLVGIITVIITGILLMMLYYIGAMIPGSGGIGAFMKLERGGYDALNAYSVIGLVSILAIGLVIPALYIANRIINYRPFSSYCSSRNGWNWKIYFKTLACSLLIYIILQFIVSMIEGHKFHNNFTALTFILAIIIIPIQCIGEEFFMRGYIMQTVGSWIEMPIIAIVAQSLFFAALHPYSILGVLGVLITGILFGFITYFTKGIEMSSGIHSANNLISFIFAGFGLSQVATNITMTNFLLNIVSVLFACALTYYISKKFGWFKEENI
ncbi:MAG: CPBP family intramembrane metalloprotease [Methanosphaera stadtmanae]|nr:CPBP family intramembrane metalloprotease [Methanosphaera stadtmanae]